MAKYSVEIWDDEVYPKKWKTIILEKEVIASDEVKRATMLIGTGDIFHKKTENKDLAKLKLQEMKNLGWKARIRTLEEDN